MKILDKYIAKQILLSIFSVLGILVVVVGLLDLVDEIKKVDEGYTLTLAFLYVLLNIPQNIYEGLPKEVKNFEPKIALLGGEDGMEHINEIVQNAPLYLRDKGWLLIENHFDQGDRVKQLFLKHSFTSVDILKDFSGIGRFTIGRYK